MLAGGRGQGWYKVIEATAARCGTCPRARLWTRMYDYMRVRYILCPFPCPARPPPSAPRTDGIPDAARWPTTHGRVRYAAARTKPSGSRRLRPPRGSPAAMVPGRGGWPLPACGEPMRIKPHQTDTHTRHKPSLNPAVKGGKGHYGTARS